LSLCRYGDGIGILRSTLHYWDVHNSSGSTGFGYANYALCSMTEGHHTYGMDIQADTMTVYYDRQVSALSHSSSNVNFHCRLRRASTS